MGYDDTYDLRIKGDEVLSNLEAGALDVTAAPKTISILRRDVIRKMYEDKASELGKLPSAVSMFSDMGFVDKRLVE